VKITTKTGDKGTTSLFGGRRVSKADPLVEVLGELDELQSFLGLCKEGSGSDDVAVLERMQDDIYKIMSVVGFEGKCPGSIDPVGEGDVEFLDGEVERRSEEAGDLKKFIRPGSTPVAARLHVARSVCRRVERRAVELDFLDSETLKYLNRMSDLLFLLAYVQEA